MALRVTARLAHRLGTIAPNHTADFGNRAGNATSCASATSDSRAQQCKAKCAVLASVCPAKTAWNWGRVFNRCTVVSHPKRRPAMPVNACAGSKWPASGFLDGQAFTALGAARVDDGAATAGLHANQETVGTCAADFGRLVSAFHLEFLTGSVLIPPPSREQISVKSPRTQSGEPPIIANFLNHGNTLHRTRGVML